MAHHNLYVRYLLACLLASLLALAAPHATSAQLSDTLTVNSTLDRVDIDPGDGVCDADAGSVTTCTLRAAIMEANALGGTQTIRVLPGEYRLTIGGIDDDESLRGDLDISSNLTIGGGSSTNRPVINGNNLDRVFHVLGAVNRVRFQNLVIRGGATSDKTSDSDAGGGIFTDVTGHVSIRNTLITNNKGNLGGGIATNRGRLTITGSTIQNNQGFGGGGGIAITGVGATNIVTILDSSIANNTASTGGGIRVDDRGFLSLDQSTVANNTATGGSSNFGGGGLLVFATGEASLTNTTISGNSASRGGGISVIGRANTNRDLQLKNATLTRNSFRDRRCV
jgi:trimeric autotransporter adhesin